MMGIRVGSLVAALVGTFALMGGPYAGTAHACSCVLAPLKDEVARSDAVFSGKVRSIVAGATPGNGGWATGRAELVVRDSWKGVAAKTVDVYGVGDGANCYNIFEVGETYIVYASRAKGADGRAPLENNACGYTRPLAIAKSDLRLLGPPTDRRADTGGPPPLAVGGILLVTGALSISTVYAVGILNRRTRP